jgi:hypothetical protein
MNTTKIFSEDRLRNYLKKYLETHIQMCDSEIKENISILTYDSDDISENPLPEERTMAHRKLEVLYYRRDWFYKQLDSFKNQ